jgi:hypothetical protein
VFAQRAETYETRLAVDKETKDGGQYHQDQAERNQGIAWHRQVYIT